MFTQLLIQSTCRLVFTLIDLWMISMFLLLSMIKALRSRSMHSDISIKCQVNRHHYDQDINSSTCIHADSFINDINVSSSISDKSSTFKKHALKHINKVSNESTSFLIHQEISKSQRVTKRKSYHLSSRDSSFKNEKSTIFSLVSKRWLSNIIQTSIKIDIRQDKISLSTLSFSSQKSKLSYYFHNFDRIFKLAFRAFCNKNQDINSLTCIYADRFMNNTSVSSFISSKSSKFKKHAFRHINKISNESTSFVFITSKLLDAFHHVFKMFTMLLTKSMITSNWTWIWVIRWINECWMKIKKFKHFKNSQKRYLTSTL